LDRNIYARLSALLDGHEVVKGPKDLPAKTMLTMENLGSLSVRSDMWKVTLKDDDLMKEIELLNEQYELQKKALDRRFDDKVEKIRRGDDLPPGVMKTGGHAIPRKRSAGRYRA